MDDVGAKIFYKMKKSDVLKARRQLWVLQITLCIPYRRKRPKGVNKFLKSPVLFKTFTACAMVEYLRNLSAAWLNSFTPSHYAFDITFTCALSVSGLRG